MSEKKDICRHFFRLKIKLKTPDVVSKGLSLQYQADDVQSLPLFERKEYKNQEKTEEYEQKKNQATFQFLIPFEHIDVHLLPIEQKSPHRYNNHYPFAWNHTRTFRYFQSR